MTDRLISLQDAINAADRADYTGLAVEDVKKVTDEVVKEIKKLPSVQPEWKRGRWTIEVVDIANDGGRRSYGFYRCSTCKCFVPDEKWLKYCPNCGEQVMR